MYKIEEIPINTIPSFSSKIYPEYMEGEYIRLFGVEGDYLLKLQTLVPIERNNIKYLIPFVKTFEEPSLTRDIEDHSEFKTKYKRLADQECENIIDNFIIPDIDKFKEDSNGIYSVIYKYKENV